MVPASKGTPPHGRRYLCGGCSGRSLGFGQPGRPQGGQGGAKSTGCFSKQRTRKAADEQVKARISSYSQQERSTRLKGLLHDCPFSAFAAEALHPTLLEGLGAFQVVFPNRVKSSTHRQACHRRLDRDWAFKNKLVRQHEQPALGDRRRRDGGCCAKGFCACGQEGREILQLKNRLLRLLKAARRVAPPQRAQLSERLVVLKLSWHLEALASAVDEGDNEASDGHFFAHIGSMLFNPPRLAFQLFSTSNRRWMPQRRRGCKPRVSSWTKRPSSLSWTEGVVGTSASSNWFHQ